MHEIYSCVRNVVSACGVVVVVVCTVATTMTRGQNIHATKIVIIKMKTTQVKREFTCLLLSNSNLKKKKKQILVVIGR